MMLLHSQSQPVHVLGQELPAVFGSEVAQLSGGLRQLPMAQVIASADCKAPPAEIAGKGLIPLQILAHPVGDLEYRPGRLLRLIEAAADGVDAVHAGDKLNGFMYIHGGHVLSEWRITGESEW